MIIHASHWLQISASLPLGLLAAVPAHNKTLAITVTICNHTLQFSCILSGIVINLNLSQWPAGGPWQHSMVILVGVQAKAGFLGLTYARTIYHGM